MQIIFCCITVQLCLNCYIFHYILAKDYLLFICVFIFSEIHFQLVFHHCILFKNVKRLCVFYFVTQHLKELLEAEFLGQSM